MIIKNLLKTLFAHLTVVFAETLQKNQEKYSILMVTI